MNLKEVFERVKKEFSGKSAVFSEISADYVLKTAAFMLQKKSLVEAASEPEFLRTALTLARLLSAGIPLPYIFGKTYFYGMELEVLPGVFIPRQETEFMVDFAVQKMREKFGGKKRIQVLDVGTGTGAIALAVASSLKNAEVTAIDISKRAVENAERNVSKLKLSNVKVEHQDFRELLGSKRGLKFDCLISNPPYIGEFERPLLPISVAIHEPEKALFGGKTGLEFYPVLFKGALKLLKKGGIFFFEIGFNQEKSVKDIARDFGLKVFFEKDYSGIYRIAWGEFS